jgi:hypothetical protein
MTRFVTRSVVAIILAVAIGVLASVVVDTQASQKPDQATSKETNRGKATEDKNVKEPEGVNKRGETAQLPAPPEKTGEKTRQVLCAVMFDNYTDLWVQAYVDGRYAGMMRPWGELHTFAIAGPTILYARAPYTDGSYDSWGPVKVSCSSTYRWRLNR